MRYEELSVKVPADLFCVNKKWKSKPTQCHLILQRWWELQRIEIYCGESRRNVFAPCLPALKLDQALFRHPGSLQLKPKAWLLLLHSALRDSDIVAGAVLDHVHHLV